MGDLNPDRTVERLLVVMPTWVGDTVMAMPTLCALRELYPSAEITVLIRSVVSPIIDACPWMDDIIAVQPKKKKQRGKRQPGPFGLARRLAARRFDTAVLLPNSFRTALLARMAGIPRRVGYDRDGRSFLLTDRLVPQRSNGRFIPISTRDYYLGIARYLGATDPDPTMRLFTQPEHDEQAGDLLARGGFETSSRRPLVLINPGANYGDAKIWYPDRFAAVADRCVREFGATAAVTGAPNESAIVDAVVAAAQEPIINLPRLGVDLTLLKSVVKKASLMITNDTGPRHMAAALNVPVVTIFGPTDPAWTQIDYGAERQVRVDVFCGPCQKKQCPLDHRCMTQVTPEMVMGDAAELFLSGGHEREEAGSSA